ncbi:MAG: 2-oxoacid:acceptor oxidoreductase subunit alpha, partial [Thermoprotei archaeon]
VMQARWGRHGDQYLVVLAPTSPQECFDLTYKAFEIAERLRVPVVVLSDEFIAHGREVVVVPDKLAPVPRRRSDVGKPTFGSETPREAPPLPPLGSGAALLITGSTHNERGFRDVHSYETHYKLVTRLKQKVWLNIDQLFVYEFHGGEDPEVLLVAYGSVARSAKEAFKRLTKKGLRASLFIPKTLWPFDPLLVKKIVGDPELVVVVEMNLGQLYMDFERAFGCDKKVLHFGKVGGGIPVYPSEIVDFVLRCLGL